MSNAPDITSNLRGELEDTRLRLAEAEETLHAIRNGEVDGLVIAGSEGTQIFTLQGAQEPYRLLIEQMSEGALTLSRDGVILYANQSFVKMLQLPTGRVIGAMLQNFLDPADQPTLTYLFYTAWREKCWGDVSARPADGSVLPLRLGLNLLQLGAEPLLCVVASDITDEQQREANSARQAAAQEAQVTERTSSLATSQLALLNMIEEEVEARRVADTANRLLQQQITIREQAQAELERTNSELARFLYTASHDLKSPLVTVRSFLGYLAQDMETGDSERITKDMDFMHTAIEKMLPLLDDLLEMARIGRVVGLPVHVTFSAVVDDVLAAVAGRITERGITVYVDESELTFYADRIRLVEIWQNLVDNACKFMGDQPAPRIDIGVETRDVETVFFVRDNGDGIDPRHLAKVFELFEQLDTQVEGTGIGLTLIKRIVELHGGRIWVESAGIGQGACFYFTLPGALQTHETAGVTECGEGVPL